MRIASNNLLRGQIAALRGARNPHVQTCTFRFLCSVRLAPRPLATVFRGNQLAIFFSRIFFGITLFCGITSHAEVFTAKVIAVMDGDTVMVLRDGQKQKIRLANIDAPEKDQAFGKQSRDSLLEMVGKKQVQIDSQAVDQYGRVIGMISVDGLNINQEQIKRGMAWGNTHFHSDKNYLAMQADAKQSQRGLWSQANPESPSLWRKSHPSVQPTAAPQKAGVAGCGSKRHCSQMSSCQEINYYLKQCGVKTLDGNHGGQPCEQLCAVEKAPK